MSRRSNFCENEEAAPVLPETASYYQMKRTRLL